MSSPRWLFSLGAAHNWRQQDGRTLVADTEQHRELDARGLTCPMPFLLARRTLLSMLPGAILTVLADDPRTAEDMAAIADAGLGDVARAEAEPGLYAFRVRRL